MTRDTTKEQLPPCRVAYLPLTERIEGRNAVAQAIRDRKYFDVTGISDAALEIATRLTYHRTCFRDIMGECYSCEDVKRNAEWIDSVLASAPVEGERRCSRCQHGCGTDNESKCVYPDCSCRCDFSRPARKLDNYNDGTI